MGSKDEGKKEQPTTGPYTWGNGPNPYGIVKRIIKRVPVK